MRWVVGVVLLAAAIGGFALSRSSFDDISYLGDLLLLALAILGILTFVSSGYGASSMSRINWFPTHGTLRWAVGGIVGVLAVMGLFHAAGSAPGAFAYYNGLGLFAVATLYEFVLLKDWFDSRSRDT